MPKATATERSAQASDHSPGKRRPSTITHGDIARRAFELYLARGCEHGRDVDDWIQSEQELRGTSRSAVA